MSKWVQQGADSHAHKSAAVRKREWVNVFMCRCKADVKQSTSLAETQVGLQALFRDVQTVH